MKIGKIIKWLFFALIAAVFAFILIRIFMLDDKRTFRDIYPTENAKSAYADMGEGAFTYHKLPMDIASNGYYMAYGMVYCEKRGEMQLTVKYNDSLTDIYLEGSDAADFRWELENENGDTLAVGKVLDTTEKYQYNYIRLAFENVEADGEIYLKLVCDKLGYPHEGEDPNLAVHTERNEFKAYKLSKEEKEILS